MLKIKAVELFIFIFLVWVIYHFSNSPSIMGIELTCFTRRPTMEERKLENWETILNLIMILNIFGEGIPQAILR